MSPVTEAEIITLRAWADVAQPGERRVYFMGFLARSPCMAGLASAAMELQQAGAVFLFQKRVGPEVYAYIEQRRREVAKQPPGA